MYFSYKFDEISEFERAALKQQFVDELNSLREVQSVLEDALEELKFSKKVYSQRSRAKKLEDALKDKIKQIELGQHLKMLTLSLCDMKKVHKALKRRRISQIDPGKIHYQLSLLEEKMNDEICREECGLKQGFKSFPVSELEVDILLETIAI
ncbi:MAG: hypothetical protein S4CHLAM6_00940 [Chlamydiae bacterium]|nr:hypothetical protein [Chlamydiota bacterium]